MLCPAMRTADPGEPKAGMATLEIRLHDVLDDRPEIAECFLETLEFRDEPLEMID